MPSTFADAILSPPVPLKSLSRFVTLIATLAICAGSSVAGRASAMFTQNPAHELAPPPTDPALFRLLARVAPGVHFVAAVSIDIDRDGDLDVAAITPTGLEIWVNEGRGRFDQQPASRHTGVSGAPAIAEGAAGSVTLAVLPRSSSDWALPAARLVDQPRRLSPPSPTVVFAATPHQLFDPSLGRAPPLSARRT